MVLGGCSVVGVLNGLQNVYSPIRFRYLYRAGTIYHFTADWAPDYVIQNNEKTSSAFTSRNTNILPPEQVAFTETLVSKVPTKYSVHIANTAFNGEIELHSPSILLENYKGKAPVIGEQPTNRF
jgi:hypothetical protein